MEMQQLEIKLAEKHIRDANEEMADKVRNLDAAKKQIATKEGVLNHKKSELEKLSLRMKKKKRNTKIK